MTVRAGVDSGQISDQIGSRGISAPADRLRILRVITRLNVGGPAQHVTILTAGLDPARYESWLVSGSEHPAEGSLIDYARAHGVEPIVVSDLVPTASLGPRDVRAFRRLYRIMRNRRPHIVHTHTAKAGFLGRLAGRLARVPIVVHTYHGHVLAGYYDRPMNVALRRMEQALARMTDCLVAVSERVRDDLVALGVAEASRVRVIPLGLELDPFLASDPLRGQFRREWGLDPTHRLVGIVGRIFAIKNHRLFLEAAALVAKADPSARFIVVGDGDLRSKMEEHARTLGIAPLVVFTGWRRDLPRIYADLDVLVVSSNNEGTPVSAIEAMAAGKPVVATHVGGLPDLVADGRSGRLVPPGDAAALAWAVIELLANGAVRARMGCEGRATAQARYGATRLVADVGRLYDELAETKLSARPGR